MIQDILQQATFKGVPFMWRRLTTQVGKKTVSHNYPGSDRRFVEDMGRLPKIFTVDGGVDGGAGGRSYLENKKALEEALASPGAGYLVHPTYGRVLVTAKQATCTEESKSLGYASYSLTFEKSEEESRPITDLSSLRAVSQAKDFALDDIVNISSDSWFVPKSPAIFGIVTDNINSLTDQINDVVGQFSSVRSEAFKVFNSIEAFKSSVSNLVTQPLALFNDLKGIYGQVMSIDDFAESEVSRFTNTLGVTDRKNTASQMQVSRITSFFGSTPDVGPATIDKETPANQKVKQISYETIEAEKNRISINEASNLMALIHSYDAVANANFDTTDQLDAAIEVIENQFNVMLESEIMTTPVRDSVIRLRIASHKVINQNRTKVRDSVTSEFKADIPIAVAQFMYSGEIGDFATQLNPTQDPTFATGEIKVLR